MKDFNETKKEFDKEMERTHIYFDSHKLDVQGCGATILSMFSQLAHHLLSCPNITKEDLKEAVEIGTMDDKELEKETLMKLKKLMKNLKESLEEEEEEEEDGE